MYQVYFHPLAKYPGPFFAKLTNLYSLYHALKCDRHSDFLALHRKHGHIVRFGPNHISINKASVLEQIYGYKVNVRKSPFYSGFYSISIFNAIDHQVHARKRRVMSQAFSDGAVRAMEPHILSAVRDWCSGIGDMLDPRKTPTAGSWSSPKDMVHWSACVIFDALGEICFGKTFEASTKPDNHCFLELMALNIPIINITGQMPWLRRIGYDRYLRRGTAASRAKQIDFSRRQLGARMAVNASATKRRDIIYFLQLARDPETGKGYSETELMGEVTLLLGAGKSEVDPLSHAQLNFP